MHKLLTLFLLLLVPGIATAQVFDNLLKAKAFTQSGKTDLAIDLLSNELTRTKSDSRLYLERAEAKMITGDYSGAVTDYKSANDISPNSGEYGLARVHALKGDAATATYHLERNLVSVFKKSEKDIMLDPAFGVIENRPEWRMLWRKEWYSSIEKSILEIDYNTSRGSITDAKIVLSQLKSVYPDNPEVQYAEGLISFSEGKFQDAVKIMTALVSADRENEKYLRLLAKAHTGNGNHSGALLIYSRLINIEVLDAGLVISRAECYVKTGETQKALVDIERYLAINPVDKKAIRMAGKAEIASGDNLKALTYFSKNLELHPDDPDCYVDRANAYYLSKTWEWALNDYSMSLDLRPDNSEVWLSKGMTLLNSGRMVDACHDFRRSFSLGNKKAAELISRHCIR